MPPKKGMRKRVYRRKAQPKVSTAVKQYVKRSIHVGRENKMFVDYGANQSITNASAGTPSGKYLLPIVSQGTAQNQRIGNEINIRYGAVRGYVNLLPYAGVGNPHPAVQLVKIWIVKGRRLNDPTITQYDWSKWFEVGATNVPFQGNTLDMVLTPNKEDFRVIATKQFKLGLSNDSAGANPANSYFDNSPMTQHFYFNFTKGAKKRLKYLDSVANFPMNDNLFIIFQAVNADGTSTSINSCEFHYQTKVVYEDA